MAGRLGKSVSVYRLSFPSGDNVSGLEASLFAVHTIAFCAASFVGIALYRFVESIIDPAVIEARMCDTLMRIVPEGDVVSRLRL